MLYHILSAGASPLLMLDNIGTSKDINNNRFGPGQRDIYLIHYVVDGKGYFNGNQVNAGQGFLIRPASYEHYFPDKENPWEYVWVTSHDKKMEEVFKQYNAERETQIFNFNSIQTVKNIIPTLKRFHNTVVAPTVILELFLRIFNSHIPQADNKTNADMYFESAENYILTHIHTPIRINEILKILGVSQPYLYKIFKARCGLSPKEYINKIKIEKAKQLLSLAEMNVSEIAFSIGYNDTADFSKFFKLSTGMSPSNYLKMLKK